MEEKVEENRELKNKSNKKFIIGFIIFLLLLILVTATAIYFSFRYIDNENAQKLARHEEEKNTKTYEEDAKKIAEDKIYALSSYAETYNENSITIEKIEDYNVDYVSIKGLKDTILENKINERIKDTVYSFEKKNVTTLVCANFSNILSLVFYGEDDEVKTLNINLATGEDIPLEKVFVSSAPFNLLLSEALYKTLAWDIFIESDEDMDTKLNMDYRDTSEYEDKFLMLVNKYKEQKGNIKFCIYPNGVEIYDFVKDFTSEGSRSMSINFIDHLEEIAIYKRYLTKESIFKDDSIGQKGIIVLTDNSIYNQVDYMKLLFYGKLTDNIFMEESVSDTNNITNEKVIKSYIDKLSKENKENIKKTIKNNQGAIYQVQYSVSKYDEGYYNIYAYSAKAVCSKEYFTNNIFRDYAKMKSMETGDGEMRLFNGYYSNTEDLKVENNDKQYFISLNGEFLGNTEEEVKAKLNPPVQEPNSVDKTIQTPENETTENKTTENKIPENEIPENRIA